MKHIQVKFQNNRPELLLDHVSQPPVLYGLSDFPAARSNTAYAQKNIANFAAQGIHMVTADTNLAYAWHKATPFDIEPIQAEIAGVLEADPDSMVLLRLHMNPPYWWLRDHPEETAWYLGNPGVDDGEPIRMIRDDGIGANGGTEGRLRVCLGSKLWLKEAGERLKMLCQQLSQTPEGKHLMGIQVACGLYGEWHQWGTDDGPCMEKHFREYLKETYQTDDNLQKNWGRDDVTIENAPFLPDVNQPGDDGIFRDPIKGRNIMDAQMSILMTVPEAILYFCRIIKENWPWPILAAAFYGSYIGSTNKNFAPIGCGLRPDIIFQEPGVVDCLCSPFPYMKNRLADGAPMSRGLLESMRLHHVLWLTEMDQNPVGAATYHGGDPKQRPETIAMLRRNCILPLLGGMGYWYYDHRIVPAVAKLEGTASTVGSIFYKKGWWDAPDLMAEIGRIQRIAEKRNAKSYRPVADVLIVYDTKSHLAHAQNIDQHFSLQNAIARSGAAFDCIYLSDLNKAELSRYRCVIFANAWQLNEAQQAEIKKLTADKQVIFLYAAGYSDEKTLDIAHIQETIGMALEKIETEGVMVSNGGVLPKESIALDENAAQIISPCFKVTDTAAHPLAYYEKSGACCAARKENIWYFALPTLSQDWARAIFKEAGCHIYGENGDAIFADQDMMMINTYSGCWQEITLRNGKTFLCDLPAMTTAVYNAQTGERYL
ncbi:MAG: hypothetical protein E7336_05915 [Clostridiales bacterium]|nr:hypothetical protein [Clostridiales bacterium]